MCHQLVSSSHLVDSQSRQNRRQNRGLVKILTILYYAILTYYTMRCYPYSMDQTVS